MFSRDFHDVREILPLLRIERLKRIISSRGVHADWVKVTASERNGPIRGRADRTFAEAPLFPGRGMESVSAGWPRAPENGKLEAMKKMLFGVLAAGLLVGCTVERDEPDADLSVEFDAEEAGEKIENTLEEAGAALERGAEAAERKLEEAGEDIQEGYERTKESLTDEEAEVEVEINNE